MNIRILLLLLLIGQSSISMAETLLVVGDSLSAAYGMPVEQGWVARLKLRLEAEGYPYELINASISGDTTANARARFPQVLDRYNPSIVLIEVGGNDGLRGLSLVAMRANIEAMIQAAVRQKACVLLIGVELPPNYGLGYNRKFNQVFKELAEEQDVALLPSLFEGIGTRPELMQADGIHPNSTAQPIILEQVWEKLRPMLEAHKKAVVPPSAHGV